MEFLEALADTANSLARFAIIMIMTAVVYLALTSWFGG